MNEKQQIEYLKECIKNCDLLINKALGTGKYAEKDWRIQQIDQHRITLEKTLSSLMLQSGKHQNNWSDIVGKLEQLGVKITKSKK